MGESCGGSEQPVMVCCDDDNEKCGDLIDVRRLNETVVEMGTVGTAGEGAKLSQSLIVCLFETTHSQQR